MQPSTFCLLIGYIHVHKVVVRDKAVNLPFVKFSLVLKKKVKRSVSHCMCIDKTNDHNTIIKSIS